MAASRREKYAPAKINADRAATQRERNASRNTGTGVSFLKSRFEKATGRIKKQ